MSLATCAVKSSMRIMRTIVSGSAAVKAEALAPMRGGSLPWGKV
jgi:hypothetical protein